MQDALVELSALDAQLRVTGAVDSEPEALAQLRRGLLAGTIAPEEAILRARALLDARSEYH